MYPLEVIEVLTLSISSALSNACGIGGGTIYSSFFLGIQEFEPYEAFPLSIFLVLCGSMITFVASLIDKYEHPKSKFVDYDIAIIIGPSMLLGTKIGTILNKIFSSFILTTTVIIIICYSIVITYQNMKASRSKEEQLIQEIQIEEIMKQTNEPLLSKREVQRYKADMLDSNNRALTAKERAILYEDELPIRYERVSFIIILEIIVIVNQLLEGNTNLSSLIGVIRCSILYWIIFGLFFVILILSIKFAYSIVKSHLEERKRIDSNYKDDKLVKISQHIIKIVILGVLAGVVSSMVGIGGGMLIISLLSILGLEPREISSTSNFLVITSTISTTLLFSFAGQLKYSYALWMAIPCSAAALVGSFLVLKHINKTKRSSFLMEIMLYLMIASLCILLYRGYYLITESSLNTLSDVFKLNSYC
jgi:uncharacterized membrane protein YfcA